MAFVSTLLISVLVTISLIPLFRRAAVGMQAMVDIPNARKVHVIPVPRIGGAAMALGAYIAIFSRGGLGSFEGAYLAGAGILVLMGLVDDYRELGWREKLASQFAAALVVVLWGGVRIESLGMLLPDGVLLPVWISLPVTLLAIVGVTNAINLSDGLDGLAGGLCLLIFSGIGALAYLDGNFAVGLISLALSGAIFGFLRFNTHPATIFMGDTGSQFLGFSAVVLSLSLTQQNTPLSPLLALVLLGFPILDTLAVMTLRLRQGKSPFAPDKNHFHHRLVSLGMSHKEAVFVIYLLQTVLVMMALLLRYHSDWLLLGGYLGFCLTVLVGFRTGGVARRRLRRSVSLERIVRNKVREIRESRVIIRYAFRALELGTPFLLVITCLLPSQVPSSVLWGGLIAAAALVLTALFLPSYLNAVTRLILYLLVPVAVYLGEVYPAAWVPQWFEQFYNLFFFFFVLLILLTLNFSTRERFVTTPKDFLFLFIAVIVPNLPIPHIQDFHLGLLAARIILLYFSFEVLFAEMRGECRKLVWGTLAALGILLV